jgi:HlyD family secretion protein
MKMSQNRLGVVGATLVLIIAVAACGKKEEEIQAPFRVEPVTRRNIVVTASAAGVVEPVTTVEVKSKASGEIVEVKVEEGDQVKAGDLLVRVDPRIPGNAVVQAEADSVVAAAELSNAESRFKRADALFKKQSITEQEFEDARLAQASAYARLVRSRSALEDAKIAFEETEVRAPSAGTILGRNVEEGSVITSASRDIAGGSVLLRMANLDTVQVRALVDESDIGKIRPDMPVTINVDAYPSKSFNGAVLRVGAEAVVEQNVTMFPVFVRIANPEHLLRPGMNAEVEVHVGAIDDALTIPNAALRSPEDIKSIASYLGLTPEQIQNQLEGTAPAAGKPGEAQAATPAGQRSVGPPPGAQGGGRNKGHDDFLFGGRYAVLVMRGETVEAVPIRTGLTDFNHVAVLEGLTADDSVLIVPTAGLLESQARFQNWARQRAGGPLQSSNR